MEESQMCYVRRKKPASKVTYRGRAWREGRLRRKGQCEGGDVLG